MQPSLASRFMPAGQSGGRRIDARRLVVMLAAMAALLWQSFIVQTHIHYPPVAAHATAGNGHRGETPNECPICREVAQAAAYLTPAPPPILAAPPAYVVLADLPVITAVLVAFVPAWRSRAPPSLSHA